MAVAEGRSLLKKNAKKLLRNLDCLSDEAADGESIKATVWLMVKIKSGSTRTLVKLQVRTQGTGRYA